MGGWDWNGGEVWRVEVEGGGVGGFRLSLAFALVVVLFDWLGAGRPFGWVWGESRTGRLVVVV